MQFKRLGSAISGNLGNSFGKKNSFVRYASTDGGAPLRGCNILPTIKNNYPTSGKCPRFAKRQLMVALRVDSTIMVLKKICLPFPPPPPDEEVWHT